MARLRLELRVGEVDGTHRGCRHFFVASPASGHAVKVSATNPAPHRAAAILYLLPHRGALRAVEFVERRPAADSHPDIWTFVATLELPDDRTTA
jgi:hypothetical protein